MIKLDEANWFEQLEQMEAEWVAIERSQNPDPQFWKWSPTPLPKVREMMAFADMTREVAELDHDPLFFDAGCGIGTKMAVAYWEFGWTCTGWELFPEYVNAATQLFHDNGISGACTVAQRDLRADEPDWASYDIVMTSRPFKDDDEEQAFERKVQDAMRPGAVLIGTHLGVKPYSWRWLYRAQWRVVAVKPLPGEPDHTDVNVPGMRVRRS